MRYEIKKILSCKILMISMIVAFIFSMAISYNAYANEKINLREFSAYIGDFCLIVIQDSIPAILDKCKS